MKLFKLIPVVALGALALTSCDDFLDKDSKDSLTVEQYLTSDANLMSFTYQLYGPYAWNTYESKFSWCANELTVGNVYHNYGDEGAFFFLNFDKTNAQLLDGYQGLYGVIGRCNMIIDNIKSQCSGCSDEAINKAIGEAKMFRGMAYFLLCEYWGESYIVLHNTADISNDVSFNVPKASRACLYAQAEKDFKEAADLLPAARWGTNGERVTKASAYGMLGKLYLTMGSATTTKIEAHPFATDKTASDYYTLADSYLTKALEINSYMETSANYENIFWPKSYNKEVIFGLYFEEGAYGAGSARQVHFARSKYLDGGDDYYGGEKGLTVSLFNSFDAKDIRKKTCSYYSNVDDDLNTSRDPMYSMYTGSTYAYYYNPNKSYGSGNQPYGSEPEGPVLNSSRKFVYAMKLENKFSCPLTIAFLRTADLYLMRAEAKMALENEDVHNASSVDLADINIVRERAGLGDLTTPIALYTNDPESSKEGELWEYTVGDSTKTVGTPLYSRTYDLLEERRHEFAFENINWLDLKRIYYRDAAAALEFITNEDRGYTYGVRIGLTKATNKNHYMRQMAINKADPSQPEEKAIDVSNVQWFFPLPSTITDAAVTFTDANAITKGDYNY